MKEENIKRTNAIIKELSALKEEIHDMIMEEEGECITNRIIVRSLAQAAININDAMSELRTI